MRRKRYPLHIIRSNVYVSAVAELIVAELLIFGGNMIVSPGEAVKGTDARAGTALHVRGHILWPNMWQFGNCYLSSQDRRRVLPATLRYPAGQ